MQYSTLLIDLDDTLYENGNGLWEAIRHRMSEYLQVKLKFPVELVPEIRKKYYETYGTTLRGLQIHHQVDTDDYLAYVHDLPLDDYIQSDAELKVLLNSLPQQKFIFTNADAAHANRVLEILDVRDCFNGIIDVRAMDFSCKSDPSALKKALKIATTNDPRQVVYLDDLARNLEPAKELGIFTILVGTSQAHPSAYRSISVFKDLPSAMPELWF